MSNHHISHTKPQPQPALVVIKSQSIYIYIQSSERREKKQAHTECYLIIWNRLLKFKYKIIFKWGGDMTLWQRNMQWERYTEVLLYNYYYTSPRFNEMWIVAMNLLFLYKYKGSRHLET